MHIYNNLQALWSSKVKFYCLSCWDDPSLDPTLVLSQLQVLFSLVGFLKKEKKGRKEEGIKKERKEEEIKKERRKEKKKRASCWLQTHQASSAGLPGCPGWVVLLFFLPELHSSQLPSLQPSSSVPC